MMTIMSTWKCADVDYHYFPTDRAMPEVVIYLRYKDVRECYMCYIICVILYVLYRV